MQETPHKPDTSGSGRLLPSVDAERCLDAQQLHDLEQAFQRWVSAARREDHRHSRQRIFLIFLIIRYSGARLNEVLSLDPLADLDLSQHTIRFGRKNAGRDLSGREVQIPEAIARDIGTILADAQSTWPGGTVFRIDPAHVRRKFYEQATAVGLPPSLGTPETLRKSRAVELMRSNMPLPVIQKILGHSTPNLAASYVEFSADEISRVAKLFAERENRRKTSARNSFFGKVGAIRRGTVQTVVEVVSLNGQVVTSVITTDSLARLGLKIGTLVTAEVKAPWIQLCKDLRPPNCSAENLFQGKVSRVVSSSTTAEVVVCLADGTELCTVITEERRRQMAIATGDQLWAFFDAFTVVLHVD